MKQAAFTLAEVLITLGIIGVVAAMTLPSLIANHQKQVYVTGLKKALNVTSNMFQKMKADDGVGDFSSTELFMKGVCNYSSPGTDADGNIINANGCEDFYGNPSVFESIIPKYLKVVKTCKGNDCNILYTTSVFTCNNNDKCSLSNRSSGKTISQVLSSGGNFVSTSYVGFYTSDGIIYYLTPMSILMNAAGIYIAVDVNGEKGPNELWRDLFIYMYDAEGKIVSSPMPLYPYLKGYGAEAPVGYLMSNGWKMDY